MAKKTLTFNISPLKWASYEEAIAKANKENAKRDKPKLNRSSVLSTLLPKVIKGELVIKFDAPDKDVGKSLKAIVIDVEMWKKIKDFVTLKESQGIKVSGGMGGIVTKLVDLYSKGSVVV